MAVTRRTTSSTGERNQHDESAVKNDSDIDQGDNTATGGDATANGGNGGNADTGNSRSSTATPVRFHSGGGKAGRQMA